MHDGYTTMPTYRQKSDGHSRHLLQRVILVFLKKTAQFQNSPISSDMEDAI